VLAIGVALFGRRAHAGFDRTFEGASVHHSVPVHADLDEARPAGWILLTTKAYQTRAAATWFGRLASEDSVLVVMQNGATALRPYRRIRDGWGASWSPPGLGPRSWPGSSTSASQYGRPTTS